MKKILITLITMIFALTNLLAQIKEAPVFISGTEGYQIYRIPAIISLPNGNLLAFAEGRVNSSDDFGNVNIVMKQSTDKGKSWSPLQVVAENGSLQAGNPAPVVDLSDPRYPNGRVFLFYNTGNNHESEVRKGNGLREVWYKTSTDGGHTWPSAINITTQVHRPKHPQVNLRYEFPEDWRAYANTPGHAMQFQKGKFKGRIFVAANHSSGDPKQYWKDYNAHGFFTDDHGKTFHLGQSVNIPGSNESMAAELSDGNLIMSSRNQSRDIHARIISLSCDGGESWDTSYFARELPDYGNEGSILNVGENKKNQKNIIAICNHADTSRMDSLTLRVSFNNGKTWKESFLIDAAPKNYVKELWNDSGYSDLVILSKNTIGVLYETNEWKTIVFKAIKFM